MARPKKDKRDSRIERITVRFTADERATIDTQASAVGMTAVEYLRRRALAEPIPIPAPVQILQSRVDLVRCTVAMNRVGVNLNQIARRLNTEGGHSQPRLDEALDELSDVVDRFRQQLD